MNNNSSVNPQERRQSLRLDMESELVAIYWRDSQGEQHSQSVVCIDVSSGGIAVSIDVEFQLDDEVEVQFNPHDSKSPKRSAIILRCHKLRDGSYHVGMSFIK
ncbi:PilZ domain-containing protein [Psychrobium sp. 1_MG-2023]|uniref:PilZ domain-containing protein n=1 Tax=Psychrobium sp. 1_MG-2023 TaxID=3062624 RepID=UPI000C33529D|nr:PilZ domain-containing protein [Psychrobium sp. 1_MG-2023]MDP2560581.1 PilZ domain-containing protein [Psychrobium sp. 1_MG-2023]PKF57568.1 pilus assembly protein PilZ [Alteromonadales bacterium alter-6D02]